MKKRIKASSLKTGMTVIKYFNNRRPMYRKIVDIKSAGPINVVFMDRGRNCYNRNETVLVLKRAG